MSKNSSNSNSPPFTLAPASIPQEQFLASTSNITLYAGSAGAGKALRHGEKVLTLNGFVNIEDIKIGDKVRTPKNTVETVIGVFPQGEVDIYRITFQDGTSVECCGEHLWKFYLAGNPKKTQVSNTSTIKNLLSKGKRPIVELCEPVEITSEKQVLPIKPYTLGVLIGDGSMSTRSVSFITDDDEIRQNVVEDGYTLNHWQQNEKRTTAKTYGVLGVQQSLRDLNLLGSVSNSKFIPEAYKKATIEDRFAIIQGLMDTDGYVDTDGSTEFCTVSLQLAKDMRDVLHSLGFTATVSTKTPTFTHNGVKKQGQLCYILYIRGRNQQRLFRLQRKVARTKYKPVGNRIVSVEPVCKDFATCISISGDEKLFITTDYIVTHNTFAVILMLVQYAMRQHSSIVVFRRTSTELKAPGGVWREAVQVFHKMFGKGVKIRDRDMEIYIPATNSIIKFSHLQHESDVLRHLSAQYSIIVYDEATTFPFDTMILPLMGRLRNAQVDYEPFMLWCTNPMYNHGIYHWIKDFYLDKDGIPLKEKSNIERYFVMEAGKPIWFDKREDAEAIYGKKADSGIRSFRSLRAHVTDNIPLLKAQPTYISNLKAMTPIKQRIYLDGSWTAREEESGYFKREWVSLVDFPNIKAKSRVRAYDIAMTLPSSANPSPDWTRGVLLSKDSSSIYTVEDLVSLRDRTQMVEKLIFETAIKDGPEVTISIPQDPNASAGAYAKDLQRRLAEMGFNCRLQKPVKSKVTRFAPVSSISQAGFLQVVKAEWNKDFFDELEEFNGEGKRKDD